MPTTLTVNGCETTLDVDPAMPLLLALRNELELTGAKLGCGLEQCGACAVLVDSVATLSCAAPVADFAGKRIETPEALDQDAVGRAVQQAFVDAGAAQCGYCIPGIVVAVTALLRQTPKPNASAVREALKRHLCRCGTHVRVLRAIDAVIAGR